MQAPLTLEQALRAHLSGSSYHGTFESHLTTEASDLAERERFRSLCPQLGAKGVLIELPTGTMRSQLMTARYHHGPIAVVLDEVATLFHGLIAAGFRVTRVKLEAVASNEGVPDSDADAARFPANNYFEFHVKLLLPDDADATALRTCCDRHAARLSRNALKIDPQGRSERFVTQRHHGVGRRTAFTRLEALERDLTVAGFVVVHRQREYTIFDSAERLDAGWLDRPQRTETEP